MRGSTDTGYFHVCTDGASLSWMFQDDQDFIAGINRIGICYLKTWVKIIAYVLMDNHVHFLLFGNMPQCKAFITLYKRLTGKWILTKYGISDYLRHLPTDIIRIDSEERLLNTIAYIDRNALIAGYSKLSGEYRWGSARYLFKEQTSFEKYKPISDMTKREQRIILGTRTIIPDDWMIDNNGMMCPLSFLDIKAIESYFKTPMRYSYFLAKKQEGVIEQELQHAQKIFIPDKELRVIVRRIAQELFDRVDINGLDVKSRLVIARKLRYDYASTVKQIARILHLDKSALSDYI